MPKKNQIKPDTILKNYWRDNAQFADLFNAVLFGGAQVIRPDELEDDDTEDSTVMEHRDIAESIETFRDNIKIRKVSNASGIQFVLLGLEHQEHIHYAMPMRIMGYDYSVYKKQYDKNAANYKTSVGMQEDEYLSRMKKTDKLVPVITILVYYGEKTWDGAVTLHEMLHIPTAWRPFVNDYKLLLVEAKKNDLKLHNINNIDLFNMLELLGDKKSTHKETKEKAIAYAKEQKEAAEYQWVVKTVKDLFEEALEGAIKVKEDTTATEKEVSEAYDLLLSRVHLLGFVGNTTDLQTAVAVAKGVSTEGKTEESVAVLEAAIAKAERMIEEANTLQEDLDAMIIELQDAIDGLEDKVVIEVNKDKLLELIGKAQAYDLTKYTKITADGLKVALEGAQGVYDNTEAVQEEVDSAYESLREAIFNLRKIPNKMNFRIWLTL